MEACVSSQVLQEKKLKKKNRKKENEIVCKRKQFIKVIKIQHIMLVEKRFLRFTTNGAFGDNSSLEVDEDDDEALPNLKSLQKLCFS